MSTSKLDQPIEFHLLDSAAEFEKVFLPAITAYGISSERARNITNSIYEFGKRKWDQGLAFANKERHSVSAGQTQSIIIAFTLKDQPFAKIAAALHDLVEKVGTDTVVIHGFMPRFEVEKRAYSTDVVDLLNTLFPVQLNMYNDGPLRTEMADIGYRLGATVYVIGEVKEGVKEEVDLYEKAGLPIEYIPLAED